MIRGHPGMLPDRECEVVDVPKAYGEPPFVVRWDDCGRQGPIFPGPDTFIGNVEHQSSEGIVPFALPDRYWWGYC